MKPYQLIEIQESGEALVPIPASLFARVTPHPYLKLGANYGDRSPYFLRETVVQRLVKAQETLKRTNPELGIQIFDAYRPVAVQQFMVDYTFAQLKGNRTLTTSETEQLWQEVYLFWANPSPDPNTPPPHSTGAAVDITLVNAQNIALDMGGEIDEIGDRSYPDHYAESRAWAEMRYHTNRRLLRKVMTEAGFAQHPNEWWHFSFGDQMWAWQTNLAKTNGNARQIAHYGRI